MHTRKERFEALVLRSLHGEDAATTTQALVLLGLYFETNSPAEEEVAFIRATLLPHLHVDEIDSIHPNILALYALVLQHGVGVSSPDPDNAKSCFELAANANHHFALCGLINFYKASNQESLMQISQQRAFDLNCAHAHYLQGRHLCNGGGGGGYSRLVTGASFLDKAIQQNHIPAMLLRAELYLEVGKHITHTVQPDKAADLLLKAYDLICAQAWPEHPLVLQAQQAILKLNTRTHGSLPMIAFHAGMFLKETHTPLLCNMDIISEIETNPSIPHLQKLEFYLVYRKKMTAQGVEVNTEQLTNAINNAIVIALQTDAYAFVNLIANSSASTARQKYRHLRDMAKIIAEHQIVDARGNLTPITVANGFTAISVIADFFAQTILDECDVCLEPEPDQESTSEAAGSPAEALTADHPSISLRPFEKLIQQYDTVYGAVLDRKSDGVDNLNVAVKALNHWGRAILKIAFLSLVTELTALPAGDERRSIYLRVKEQIQAVLRGSIPATPINLDITPDMLEAEKWLKVFVTRKERLNEYQLERLAPVFASPHLMSPCQRFGLWQPSPQVQSNTTPKKRPFDAEEMGSPVCAAW